jgi:SAM-dependent methyltransferase
MACARNERHRYGQHYTPNRVARLLAALAVTGPRDRVLDPSCGDGRLLEACLERKLELAAPNFPRSSLAGDLFGIDRSRDAVAKARSVCSNATAFDFFDVRPGTNFPSTFDAIIGNPPYIRQELMTVAEKRRIARLLRSNQQNSSTIHFPRFSGRSDIYVFFFAHAINFLREGGRLVFLTSASWLDSGYGAPLREFLLGNFRILSIVESAAESFFDDASINTVITALERCSDENARRQNRAPFAQLSSPIEDGVELAARIEKADRVSASEPGRLRIVDQDSLGGIGGWGKYLRADEVFFHVTNHGAGLARLGDLARVRFGVKTGANDFFYLENPKPRRGAHPPLKRLGEVAKVRRGLTTGANQFFYLKGVDPAPADAQEMLSVRDASGQHHLIESRFLSPVVFSLKELDCIRLRKSPEGRLFFNCQSPPHELRGTGALKYIRTGERAGHHQRPSCSARVPWYSVARGMKPAPLLFPSKVGERWLIALNEARVFEDKKLYGIFPAEGVNAKTLAALLNSTWARYYIEVTCRQMTGAQAIADIDVIVAHQLLIPDPRSLPAQLESELGRALDSLAKRPVLSVFDEVERSDRQRLDDLTLRAMGFSDSGERAALRERLHHAVMELVTRRLAGSRNK